MHQSAIQWFAIAQHAGMFTSSVVVVIVVVGASTIVVVVVGYCTCQTSMSTTKLAPQRRHSQSGKVLEHRETDLVLQKACQPLSSMSSAIRRRSGTRDITYKNDMQMCRSPASRLTASTTVVVVVVVSRCTGI